MNLPFIAYKLNTHRLPLSLSFSQVIRAEDVMVILTICLHRIVLNLTLFPRIGAYYCAIIGFLTND